MAPGALKTMAILIDKSVLAEVRALPCDICYRSSGDRQAHHIHRRGMGAGKRFDHKWNCLSVCNFPCHAKADRMSRIEQVKIVAEREGVPWEEVEAFLAVSIFQSLVS